MFRVRVNGDLGAMMREVYRAFEAGSGGSSVWTANDPAEVRLWIPPYTYLGVGLLGSEMRLDRRGDAMILGEWAELRVESVRPAEGGGVERVTFLRITGFSADPSTLMSFVGDGLGGTTFWRFDDASLHAALNPSSGIYLGGAGNDRISPYEPGREGLLSLRGADTLRGGAGDDWLNGGAGRDLVYGGTGADTLWGGSGGDLLQGHGWRDHLFGGYGADTLQGGRQADVLYGEGGGDHLYGGPGNDTLDGGNGDDRLTGGYGADVFQFRRGGHDTVEDFNPLRDRVALAARLVPAEERGDAAAWFVAQARVSDVGLRLDLADGTSVTFLGVSDPEAIAATLFLV